MKIETISIGDNVLYIRGSKGPLIGKEGRITSNVDKDGIVMVYFHHCKNEYPCWINNLIKCK